ncbi:DUF6308 family protein [Blastococcus sp. SYSU D00813]
MPPISVSQLVRIVEAPRAVDDVRTYFEPDRAPRSAPRHPGSRFEFLGGGGDRPETANRITADDLVAVTLRSGGVPGDVALDLLEGDLGEDVAWYLEHIPMDVGIEHPSAGDFFGTTSSARTASYLLEEPDGMDWFLACTLLARKRPRMLPVHDRVARCLHGGPDEQVGRLLEAFEDDDARLHDRLVAVREAAGVPEQVSALRVLDVITWMRHRPDHLENHCRGLV